MKARLVGLAVVVSVVVLFALRPQVVDELTGPFRDDETLLAAALAREGGSPGHVAFAWPGWLIRFVAGQRELDFATNLGENDQSKLQFVLAALFEHEQQESAAEEIYYVLSMAQRAIDEGADIDHMSGYGLSALHEAVLFGSTNATRLLTGNGADCGAQVSRPGKPIDGMTALEMARYLSSRDDRDRTAIVQLLRANDCSD